MQSAVKRQLDGKIIAGVCAGLANYFGIDPIFIRLIFVVLTITHGVGILAYIILWVLMPQDTVDQLAFAGRTTENTTEFEEHTTTSSSFGETTMEHQKQKNKHRQNTIGGVVLIALGLIFLADNFLPEFNFGDFWPLILVAVGATLLWNNFRSERTNQEPS